MKLIPGTEIKHFLSFKRATFFESLIKRKNPFPRERGSRGSRISKVSLSRQGNGGGSISVVSTLCLRSSPLIGGAPADLSANAIPLPLSSAWRTQLETSLSPEQRQRSEALLRERRIRRRFWGIHIPKFWSLRFQPRALWCSFDF